MPQGDEEGGEVEGALKDGNQAVVADLDASEILEPGVGAFDFPAFAVSAQLAFVFEAAIVPIMRRRSITFRCRHSSPSAMPKATTLHSRMR